MELINRQDYPPKLVLGDRIFIVWDKDKKLNFYDVMRQKFVAKLNDKVKDYCVVGDELLVQHEFAGAIKQIHLPFSPKARDGDFLFYSTKPHSIFQSPFTSVDDLIPSNRLQAFDEFAFYPSC